jgi:hypothetical protein
MRKEVLRRLREEFKQKIEADGDFLHATENGGAPGSDLYIWKFSPELTFFVYLLPNPKSYHDAFMVELGWTSGTQFPRQAPMQNKQRLDLRVDGRIRLPSLWREQWRSALEPWWETGHSLASDIGDEFYTEKETLRRVAAVPELVEDAIKKIEEYGIPFFQRIAAERHTSGN